MWFPIPHLLERIQYFTSLSQSNHYIGASYVFFLCNVLCFAWDHQVGQVLCLSLSGVVVLQHCVSLVGEFDLVPLFASINEYVCGFC